jgi:hypothetical protein
MNESVETPIQLQQQIATTVDNLINALPNIKGLTSEECRGIIARYSSVLEGNFIYWMTATFIAAQSREARDIIIDNLHEEVRDSHPAMLRKFAIAAKAFPTDVDALDVNDELTKVRLFLGKLDAVQSLVAMAFFESFIQRFMGFLADLAAERGSVERVYTDVHGVCDIEHSQELFRAIALEMIANPASPQADLFEGVDLICALLETVVHGSANTVTA